MKNGPEITQSHFFSGGAEKCKYITAFVAWLQKAFNGLRLRFSTGCQVEDLSAWDASSESVKADYKGPKGETALTINNNLRNCKEQMELTFRFFEANDILTALSSKTEFCSFVVSNNNASPERDIIFDKLSEYKKVSSGGRYRNHVGGPVSDKLEFQRKHKFAIAFENCSQPGYSTEKILEAFAARTVPIYWGGSFNRADFQREFIHQLTFF